MTDKISILQSSKNSILFIELAGLLHDIGKLSKAFLEYRQKWQDNAALYDPHSNEYLDKYEVEELKPLIPDSFKTTMKDINASILGGLDFSIKKAIHFHIEPGNDLICKMLKATDGKDSAIDRNNPLWCNEQKEKIFYSNVFGYESGKIVNFKSQKNARKKLYQMMRGKLPEYFKTFEKNSRNELFGIIKQAFEQGLADTTRPQNDTTLWEHSYAVASILKAITVHNLFCIHDDRIDSYEKVKFGILGIGWDGIRFISYGQKIGDIIGRKRIIDQIKVSLKDLIEHEYPIGNEIYADDNGIYFIVPVNYREKLSEIWEKIEDEIYRVSAHKSERELQPHIADVPDTTTLTSLVTAINRLKEKIPFRFDSSVHGFKHFSPINSFKQNTICPICRQRPVEDEKNKVCGTCNSRRIQREKGMGDDQRKETAFVDEIADKNRRAALVVARFGLDKWLGGEMVRSLFVTEADGIRREIEALGTVEKFKEEEIRIKEFFSAHDYGPFNYKRIKDDIDSLFLAKDKERAKYTAFLYDRREVDDSLFRDINNTKDSWEKSLDEARKEHPKITIHNLLNAKTPTPSTILDIWNTTQEFYQDIANKKIPELLPTMRRLEVAVNLENENNSSWEGGTIEAENVSTGKKIELLWKENGRLEVIGEAFSEEGTTQEWKDVEIRITDKQSRMYGKQFKVSSCRSGQDFLPYRVITISPVLFMAIVPADKAVEISDQIYSKYIDKLGKVIGRLPLSIGNIFFGKTMPMFVVLDSGKRMAGNFERLAGKEELFKIKCIDRNQEDPPFDIECNLSGLERSLTWHLPYKLGDGKTDFHHPYFPVQNTEDLSSSRSTFFETVAGNVVHFSEIKERDTIKVYPNYYDFEFLDSNARRHDIFIDDSMRRSSHVIAMKSKPFLLDELNQKFVHLWENLLHGKQLKGITDTKLKNLQALWVNKHQEWASEGSAGRDLWMDLVRTSLQKEFKGEHRDLLLEVIRNGIFFDTLDLYHGILKKRIETK